jgi:branched-chain amino acid aminotransferase
VSTLRVVINGSGIRGVLAPTDRGFLLGDALFETVRLHGGRPFRLQQHLDRMRRSARHLQIDVPLYIEAEVASVLAESAALRIGDARFRITLSRGASRAPGLSFDRGAGRGSTLVLTIDPIADGGRISDRGAGVTAVLAKSRRNEFAATAGHKTVGFADAIVELSRARADGFDDCIFLDTCGHVSEASTSNVFLFDGETLITPGVSCGILPGITRMIVLEIAAGMGLPVQERVVEREELMLAREVFLTNSIAGIVPLSRIEGIDIGGARIGQGSRVGELTSELMRRYENLVNSETGAD